MLKPWFCLTPEPGQLPATKLRRWSPCEAKLTTFWPGAAEPDSDPSPKHSSLYQILHPGSCLPPYPPPARTSRRVAKRDVAHRGQAGWGAASCPPSGECASEPRGGKTVTKMGTGKDRDWKKEESCCRLLKNTASSKVVTRECSAEEADC